MGDIQEEDGAQGVNRKSGPQQEKNTDQLFSAIQLRVIDLEIGYNTCPPATLPTRPAPDSIAESQPDSPSLRRLGIGILVAPELTTVRLSRLAAPGYNVGLVLEYRLASRLRAGIGVVRSLKRYTAKGTDYSPADDHYAADDVRRIDAVCEIIELPLYLRYDLVQRPRRHWFLSAGTASLLMRSELYTYTYAYPHPAEPAEQYRGPGRALGALLLTGGYERQIGPRWTLQAEPFMKLPLGGVGYGRVQLSSIGANFLVKYALR
jgi:hypothetical protein